MSPTRQTLSEHNRLSTYAILLVIAAVAWSAWNRERPAPQPVLVVRYLEYRDGLFEQIVVAEHAPALAAQFEVEVIDVATGIRACGEPPISAVYPAERSEPLRMTPEVWAGASCSVLEPGREYRADVTWTWRDTNNKPRAVGAEITFTR